MSALLIALFVLGIAVGLLMTVFKPSKPKSRQKFHQHDSLDTIDEMFLWGEVNHDKFYDGM